MTDQNDRSGHTGHSNESLIASADEMAGNYTPHSKATPTGMSSAYDTSATPGSQPRGNLSTPHRSSQADTEDLEIIYPVPDHPEVWDQLEHADSMTKLMNRSGDTCLETFQGSAKIFSHVNPPQFSMAPESRFICMKVENFKDMQYCINNGFFTNIPSCNERYMKMWNERDGQRVFLFCSINGEKEFCAMAEMTGPLEPGSLPGWSKSGCEGIIPITFIYVKMVPFKLVNHIKHTASKQPVANMWNSMMYHGNTGYHVAKIYIQHPVLSSLLVTCQTEMRVNYKAQLKIPTGTNTAYSASSYGSKNKKTDDPRSATKPTLHRSGGEAKQRHSSGRRALEVDSWRHRGEGQATPTPISQGPTTGPAPKSAPAASTDHLPKLGDWVMPPPRTPSNPTVGKQTGASTAAHPQRASPHAPSPFSHSHLTGTKPTGTPTAVSHHLQHNTPQLSKGRSHGAVAQISPTPVVHGKSATLQMSTPHSQGHLTDTKPSSTPIAHTHNQQRSTPLAPSPFPKGPSHGAAQQNIPTTVTPHQRTTPQAPAPFLKGYPSQNAKPNITPAGPIPHRKPGVSQLRAHYRPKNPKNAFPGTVPNAGLNRQRGGFYPNMSQVGLSSHPSLSPNTPPHQIVDLLGNTSQSSVVVPASNLSLSSSERSYSFTTSDDVFLDHFAATRSMRQDMSSANIPLTQHGYGGPPPLGATAGGAFFNRTPHAFGASRGGMQAPAPINTNLPVPSNVQWSGFPQPAYGAQAPAFPNNQMPGMGPYYDNSGFHGNAGQPHLPSPGASSGYMQPLQGQMLHQQRSQGFGPVFNQGYAVDYSHHHMQGGAYNGPPVAHHYDARAANALTHRQSMPLLGAQSTMHHQQFPQPDFNTQVVKYEREEPNDPRSAIQQWVASTPTREKPGSAYRAPSPFSREQRLTPEDDVFGGRNTPPHLDMAETLLWHESKMTVISGQLDQMRGMSTVTPTEDSLARQMEIHTAKANIQKLRMKSIHKEHDEARENLAGETYDHPPESPTSPHTSDSRPKVATGSSLEEQIVAPDTDEYGRILRSASKSRQGKPTHLAYPGERLAYSCARAVGTPVKKRENVNYSHLEPPPTMKALETRGRSLGASGKAREPSQDEEEGGVKLPGGK